MCRKLAKTDEVITEELVLRIHKQIFVKVFPFIAGQYRVGSLERFENGHQPSEVEKIRELIAAFDAKTKEVYIEARIIEITLDDDSSMGIDWQKILTSTDNLSFTGSYAFSAPSSSTAYQQVSIGTLAADNYTATLKAIQYYGKTTLLSSPLSPISRISPLAV